MVAAAVCVAGVALGDIYLYFVAGVTLGNIDFHFVWQVWRLWHWAGSGDAPGSCGRRVFVWQAWHLATSTFTFAALGDIDLHFVLQVWHLWHWAGSGVPRLFVWQAALGDIDLHFVWQSWHAFGDIGLHFVWQGGAYGTGLALVARLCPVVAAC